MKQNNCFLPSVSKFSQNCYQDIHKMKLESLFHNGMGLNPLVPDVH